jgi:uncharacterized protein
MGFVTNDYAVWLNGQNVTSRLDPLLTSIKVTRASEAAADTCDIALADADGQIALPGERAPVLVFINGARVFSGFVSDVTASFSKGEGRALDVSASSVDNGSKVKEPVLRSADDLSFSDVARQWGQKAGLSVTVAGSVASVARPYWIMQNEDFLSWGQRMAREIGASFKILGSEAYFVGVNEGVSGSGKTLTAIEAVYGDNLISGSISPIISRPKFKNVEISYFDVKKGRRVNVPVETGIDDVDAALRTVISAADEAEAKQKAQAIGKQSDREKGGGSVVILGAEYAEPEAICNIRGVRPGVDGGYRIASVTHDLTKSGGFLTTLDLKQPQSGAGTDTR